MSALGVTEVLAKIASMTQLHNHLTDTALDTVRSLYKSLEACEEHARVIDYSEGNS